MIELLCVDCCWSLKTRNKRHIFQVFLCTAAEELLECIQQTTKLFFGVRLDVSVAPENTKLMVRNLKPEVNETLLELHFTSTKVAATNDIDVEVEFDPQNHVAIIKFSDASGISSFISTFYLHLYFLFN
jgi:hypothetical protein